MDPMPKRILIVAGEASADRYGASLVQKLRPVCWPSKLDFYGTGGDQMEEAGVHLLCHIRELASIGPREALSHLSKYHQVYRRIVQACGDNAPAVAVLIDFPDFNLRLLKKLKQRGVRIVYYVGPQLWAWRRGRVRVVRRYVDKMAVILPFEEGFYRERGVAAEFVGHPILEDFSPDCDRKRFLHALGLEPERKTVTLLPGSRRQEVEYILPVLLRASARILQEIQAQFLISVAPTIEACQMSRILSRELGGDRHPYFRLVSARACDALACSDFGFVKSGTSTLEAALVGTPFLVTYRISPVSWFAGNILIRSPLKGLVNLVVGEEIVPELLQGDATPETLSRTALSYLNSPAKTDAMRSRLAKVREMLGARHASDSVAAMVAGYL
jgi:lipid-A-disaccharide synthase